ncbi:hypothetical protein [Raineya sp.]|jgi:hypothetical protein
MAYADFSLEKIEKEFGIENQIEEIFSEILPIEPSDYLKKTIEAAKKLPMRSEKARSEGIVFPVLLEMRERNNEFFTIYSGENLNVEPEKGLNGECDFIIAKDTKRYDVSFPILQIVEAKKNDLDGAVPQCAAQMVGAKIFNQKKGYNLPFVYGCVTTGEEWLFMKLAEKIFIDNRKYFLNELTLILGVLQEIINQFKRL